ncbi:Lipase (class 3) [Nannocystis exedens]|uniref:Lipase (Class 3) n=1 Tax=Nannocystis exedens TaxID=54 RepID=A0A1I2IC79_9BACT|nr:hypothetical protein [Nannocystis exedens]PCC67141.1 lipase [Nannocystis exedens]SFF39895.1 Lipase (class 3) [Nannocystis exedens]
MTTDFPSQVQTFALSMFANAVQSSAGQDLGLQAAKQIGQALTNAAGIIGQWRIVWGPGVVVQPGNQAYSENLMYVVQNVDQPAQYVIAIAGTNFKSTADSLIEDCFVFKQVPWLYNLAAVGAKISLGSAIGLLNLQSVKPAPRLPGAGTTLVEFLRTIVGQNVQITVAGHSLGGALAPTVALWLADTAQGLLFPWDPKKNAVIGAQAYAGPTAGNLEFAVYSGVKLGAQLRPCYNTMDVVPHAWQELGEPSLSELAKLYAPDLAPPKADASYILLKLLLDVFRLLALGQGYAPLPNLEARAGKYDPSCYTGSNLDTFTQYLQQLGHQHIPAYYDWFQYKKEWMPADPQRPVNLSPELMAIAQKSASADDFVRALQSRTPRKIQVGDAVVDAPNGPGDPQADKVAAMVEAAFAKQAGVSAAS